MTNELKTGDTLKGTDGKSTVFFKVIRATDKSVWAYRMNNFLEVVSDKVTKGRMNKFGQLNMGMSIYAKKFEV